MILLCIVYIYNKYDNQDHFYLGGFFMKIMVRADDLGYSRGVNYGI